MGDAENNAAMNIILGQVDGLVEETNQQIRTAPEVTIGDTRCPDHKWVITSAKLTLRLDALVAVMVAEMYKRAMQPTPAPAKEELPWGKITAAGGFTGAVIASIAQGLWSAFHP